ncbi:MAG: hypothetical protein ACLQGP_12225 [Isosphaeraceae bacterium]
MEVYRNGKKLLPAMPSGVGFAPVASGKPAEPTGEKKGQLANFRVFSQAQTAPQISATMAEDQTALWSFRRTYPIEFSFLNDEEQSVLFMSGSPTGPTMHLQVINASRDTMTLVKPKTNAVGKDCYHFALRFRNGILDPSMTRHPSWEVLESRTKEVWTAALVAEPDGVVLYLLHKDEMALPPGQPGITFDLPDMRPDEKGGSRTTRIELGYDWITLPGGSERLSGSRTSHLALVNHRGDVRVPLHLAVSGCVLNDEQTLNKVRLRLTNTDPDSILTLQKGSVTTFFELSLDIQGEATVAGLKPVDEWALATKSEVAPASLTFEDIDDWDWLADHEGERPVWRFTPKKEIQLRPRQGFSFTMSGLVSSGPAGSANLYIHYENIPGYWDGELVAEITKSPIVVTSDKVGIGTANPRTNLHVVGDLCVDSGGPEAIQAFKLTDCRLNFRLLNREQEPTESDYPKGAKNEIFIYHHKYDYKYDEHEPGETMIHAHEHHIHINKDNFFLCIFDAPGTKIVDVNFAYLRIFGRYDALLSSDQTLADLCNRNVTLTKNDSEFGPLVSKISSIVYPNLLSSPRLTLQGPGRQLLILRETAEFGGPVVFLDLYDPNGNNPEVTHPCVRFWHQNHFMIRIEADGAGFHFKDGDTNSDKYVDIRARTIRADTKTFRIPHPTTPGSDLVHACLEGPESAVYYRGRGRLRDGLTTVRLPDYFEGLTRKEGRTVTLTAIGREPFLLSYEDVVDGAFLVHGTKPDGEFSWELKAVRADVLPLEVEVDRKTPANP